MKLIRRRQTNPTEPYGTSARPAAPAGDGRCRGTTSKGNPCPYDAKPDGYCGAFHTPDNPGGRK